MQHPYFQILGALTKSGIHYAVVGQMGPSFYGSDQTTYDLDLFIEPNKEDLSHIRKFFRKKGFAEVAVFQEQLLKPPPTDDEIIQKKITLLFAEPSGLSIDVMTAISGLEFKTVWKKCQTFLVGKEKVIVAALDHIILSKEKAGRKKDRLHIPHLKKLLR